MGSSGKRKVIYCALVLAVKTPAQWKILKYMTDKLHQIAIDLQGLALMIDETLHVIAGKP